MNRTWPDRALITAGALLLVAVVVRLAWLSDDAYITLRVIENWLGGHGLVWNVGDRVQVNTHPLWTMLLALCRAVSGEAFFTTIAVSIVLAGGAVLRLLLDCRGAAVVFAVTAVLLSARSFPEYATGGLDNPLAYLLLVELAIRAMSPPPRSMAWLTLLAAALTLTRYDLVLLAAPGMVAAVYAAGPRRSLRPAALGALPLFVWVAVATFYFGTPWPITGHAKIDHGVPAADLWWQGLRYLDWLMGREPATLLAIAGGIALGLRGAVPGARPLAIGALLYCLYVVKVGGDFMAARLLTPPLVVCTAIVARWLGERPRRAALSVGSVALVLLPVGGTPRWLLSPAAEAAEAEQWQAAASDREHGLFDERTNYWSQLGLLSPQRDVPMPGEFSAVLRRIDRAQRSIMVWGQVGRFGFEAGDLVHLVDRWLCDPLLMRLPATSGWRIGHFMRAIPDGYLETLASGEERLRDAGLARFHATLRQVISGPLWSTERFAAMWRLWTGADADGLRDYIARIDAAERVDLPWAELSPSANGNRPWFAAPAVRVSGRGGLALHLPAPVEARTLRVSVNHSIRYDILLRRGATTVAKLTVDGGRHELWRDEGAVFAEGERIMSAAPRFLANGSGYALLRGCCLGMQQIDVPVPAGTGTFDTAWVDVVAPPLFHVAAFGGIEIVD